jgi:PAS domain S-box-containing protein
MDTYTGAREREARYKALLDSVPDVLALLDHDGCITFVTGAVERITGYSASDLLGRQAFEQVHPRDLGRVRAAFVEMLATPDGPVSVQYRSRHRNGSWRRSEAIAVNRLNDPAIRAIVVTYRDAQERVSTPELAGRHRIYESVFEDAGIGIAYTDVDGRFLTANRWLCDALGYSREEFQALDFAAIWHPDELRKDTAGRTGVLDGARDSYTCERRCRRKDGHYLRVNVTITVHREISNEPPHFILVIEELTQRTPLDEQLRQSRKMEAVGRLAGGIAHDFNNLLTAIVGFAELALKALSPMHPVRADVEQIRAAGESATSLTHQLLAFSRQQVLAPHVIDLNEVVSGIVPLLSRLIDEHIDVQWHLDPALDAVFADSTQLEQVVLNLALNARDAMPDGGTLAIETSNAVVDGTSYVAMAISDTGVGMDDAVKEHLFEPFYTTKHVGKGTGLGLATVYDIVNQSGGRIRVHSEVGHGTTFRIFLPRARHSGPERLVSTADPAMLGGRESVLIVEDQREVRSVTAEVLRRHGYDVMEAANGAAAVAVAAGRRVDLLLTDAVMPGMGGRTLANRLRPERAGMHVLYMSGYANTGTGQREFVDPAAAFIQKPFTPEVLLRKVREVLDTPRPEVVQTSGDTNNP